MREARCMRLIPWTLQSGSEQSVRLYPKAFQTGDVKVYIAIILQAVQNIHRFDKSIYSKCAVIIHSTVGFTFEVQK